MDNINYKVLLQHCVNILDSHHYYTNKHLDVLINNNMNFYSEEELYKKYIANKKVCGMKIKYIYMYILWILFGKKKYIYIYINYHF